MTAPMLVISSVLLGLIFHFRVVRNDFVSDNLAFDANQLDRTAYFVDFSATALITLASWSSTLAPILIGFAVKLVSFPVAKGMLEDSQREAGNLPTPYQLSLTIQMIETSGLASLVNWIIYAAGWRGKRESQGRALKILTKILMLGIVMSGLILATDTWLHLATRTIVFYQIGGQNTTDVSSLSFGIAISGSYTDLGCTDTDSVPNLIGCNVYQINGNDMLIFDPEPLQVLANISDTAVLNTYSRDGLSFVYLGSPSASLSGSLDYSARSFAIQSSCAPITSQCLRAGGDVSYASALFNCSFDFTGGVLTGPKNDLSMAYFTDSTGSHANTTSSSTLSNPYYYAAMAAINVGNIKDDISSDGSEVVQTQNALGDFIGVFCNSTVYDIEYSSVNGTITRFETQKSNSSTTRIVQASQMISNMGEPYMLQSIGATGVTGSLSKYIEQFELAYSYTALAVGSSGFETRPAVEWQTRNEILVARVPKAPLYCLVVENLLLVVLGIALTAIALITVRGDTRELQARLSISAIVGALLQEAQSRVPLRQMYECSRKRQVNLGQELGL